LDVDRDSGEGLWARRAAASPGLDGFDGGRDIEGDPDTDLEGGREFKSGAIEGLYPVSRGDLVVQATEGA